ncbi:MAG: nitroreductase [Lachnospiraceae bacterium]|nr:nitroreductase [Lachnospiraceae bacterium]
MDITMSDIEAIRARHSVRNYKPEAIAPETLALLKAKIEELNAAGDLHLQLIENAGSTYNRLLNRAMGLSSAPSVIACIGKDSENLDQRVGYYGEQLVLYAQKLGLNTCWAGTFNRKNIGGEYGEEERLVISIAIGYGEDQGNPHRSKSADQVSEAAGDRPEWFEKGVELALLAPTAVNQQKFLIRLNADSSVDFIDNTKLLGQVDLGIVRYHFEVGSGVSCKP